MNRAERRRNKSAVKPKTYTLTDVQIRQLKDDATSDALKMLLCIPMLVLHDKFSDDHVDLDRFLHYCMGWVDGIQKGEVSVAEVVRLCEEETGLKIKEK